MMNLVAVLVMTFLSSVAAENPVLFSAGITSNQNLSGNVVVVFNQVLLNQGGGYNNTTGVFTTTKGGFYVFHVHVVSQQGKDAWLQLYKNDDYLISNYGYQTGLLGTGGNSVSLKLKKGDRIYVKTGRAAWIYGSTNQVYTTFTGYFVAPWKT